MTSYQIAIYLFASLFTVAIFIFVFSPVHDREEGGQKTRLAYLYERKDVVYDNLRDLNFEHKAGKFSEADFETMRSAMEAEAAHILAEIDSLEAVA